VSLRSRFVVVALLLGLGACASSPRVERLSTGWSDSAATILPGPEPAPESDAGRLTIVNVRRRRLAQPEDRSEPTPFRGFAVYDAQGVLVYSCPDCQDDTHVLRPGKYIVVGCVEYGLTDYSEKRAQFVIAAGRTTVVDFRRITVATVPEGAKTQDGSPMPGTGRSR
jgi:hypothetical protein